MVVLVVEVSSFTDRHRTGQTVAALRLSRTGNDVQFGRKPESTQTRFTSAASTSFTQETRIGGGGGIVVAHGLLMD